MQNGSVIRAERRRGPDVWEYRDGASRARTAKESRLADEAIARQAISVLQFELNRGGAWLKTRSTTVSDLVRGHVARTKSPRRRSETIPPLVEVTISKPPLRFRTVLGTVEIPLPRISRYLGSPDRWLKYGSGCIACAETGTLDLSMVPKSDL